MAIVSNDRAGSIGVTAAVYPRSGAHESRPHVLYRLYRVADWLHFLPLPLAGWVAAGSEEPMRLVGGVVALAFAFAYASAINHAFDDELDRPVAGKNPVGTALGRRAAVCLSIPMLLGALAFVALWSPQAWLPCLTLLVASTVYSAPPRLKRVPVLGALCNLVIGVPALFFAGQPEWSEPSVRVLVGLFSLLLLVSQLLHEAADRQEDRRAGVTTVGTWLGAAGTLIAASLLAVGLPLASWILADSGVARLGVTLASAVFGLAWAAIFVAKARGAIHVTLWRLRLGYRYTALALGTLVYLMVRTS